MLLNNAHRVRIACALIDGMMQIDAGAGHDQPAATVTTTC